MSVFALTPAASSTATMTSMNGNLLSFKYYSLTGCIWDGQLKPVDQRISVKRRLLTVMVE